LRLDFSKAMPTQAIPRQQIATQGQVQGSALFPTPMLRSVRYRRAAPELLSDLKPIDGGLEASFRALKFLP
jgi:hypothetical protein